MLKRHFYYTIKPFLPWRLRMALRRLSAGKTLKSCRATWPINPAASHPPADWPGWPDGHQFAFVLTHDVEGPTGLAHVRRLAELEMKHGFRSSFNFVPEGSYVVPPSLRSWLAEHGFEVGVHDLHHDGQLYRSREVFARRAKRINRHLREWGAAGFRAAFMLNELDWHHDLEIAYDASTFDTDPFEPQPEGRETIFPFFVRRNDAAREPGPSANHRGYVELPYTLPQDSTLFLLLREKTPEIWLRKLDWIAERRGMAMLIVHPDYLRFEDEAPGHQTFPVAHYESLLRHVREHHGDKFWPALPRQVARFVHETSGLASFAHPNGNSVHPSRRTPTRPKIWIDLDNTPHVPFFEPIIEELRSRGYPLVVTARDAFQVCELADKKKLSYVKVGRHHGKNRLRKGCGLAFRAMQLAPLILREKPALGVSHGARSQLLLGNFLRLPTLLIEDYEFSQFPRIMRPTWTLAPEAIRDDALASRSGHSLKYPGIKEDVYAWKLTPDGSVLRELGVNPSELAVTVRPPATEAHYHNPESEKLFERFMDRATCTAGVRVILLPRNHKQETHIRANWPEWFSDDRTVVPSSAIDGLNLMWHSDLVVSGGGTMNREAAAIGVPVYSIFRGSIGAVDRHLSEEGRLTLIDTLADVDHKIALEKRERPPCTAVNSSRTLEHVVGAIIEIAERYSR